MRYAVVSDVHFLHERTPTKHIVDSFIKTILTEANTELDVLFINGDLFDQRVELNKTELKWIIKFINSLLNYCFKYNVKLRILEGTPSHDYLQSQRLVDMNDIREQKVDLEYFQVLEIEYFSEYDKYVLYIPDEHVHSQEELEKKVNEKLRLYNIAQVDMAMLHGSFKYQTKGMNTKSFSYDEDYFHTLTKGFIHIGHHHNFTTHGRIIANGSLDRLAHNEEEDKGYVVVNEGTYIFVINPYSYIYKTITVNAKTTLASLDKQVFKYPKGSHIRIKMSKEHEFNSIWNDLKIRYADYQVKKQNKDSASEVNSATYILSDEEFALSDNLILETDIRQTLEEQILAKHSFNPSEKEKLLGYLKVFETVTSEETL